MDRRAFLQSAAFGVGSLWLSQVLRNPAARAAVATDRHFVFAYFNGGWDTLLSLDPRDPAVFTDSRVGETQIQLAWDLIPPEFPRTIIQPPGSNLGLGPAMASIAKHFDQMCVVRGVSMDTVTHEVGRRYFLTGMMPRGTQAAGSSIGTRVAAQQGNLRPVPHLVSRVESYNERDPFFASGMIVASPADLVAALTDGTSSPTGDVRARLDTHRGTTAHCDPVQLDRRGLMSLVTASQAKARDLVKSGAGQRFAFNNTTDPEIAALRTRYQITGNNFTGSGAQAALAFQALRYGLAQCVTIELAQQLDTHGPEWADDQPVLLARGFEALSQLIQDLKDTPHPGGGTFIEHTTLVAFSEFGRTPRLNNRDGRDHWITSSCLLAGRGVPHNRVIGASSDRGMGPLPIDPNTGNVVESGGVVMNPNSVLASVMASAGFDTDRLRSDGLPCLIVA